jgi:serine/threonine-protein kinase PRP4
MEKLKMEQQQKLAVKTEPAESSTQNGHMAPPKLATTAIKKEPAAAIDLFGDSIKKDDTYKASPLTPMPGAIPPPNSAPTKPSQPLISGIGGAKVAIDLFEMKFDVDTSDSKMGSAQPELGMVMREVDPSDDTQGYYAFRIGEILFKKYQVTGFHGQGVFSSVLKATDIESKKEVAIKLLRNNDHMKRTGRKEMRIWKALTESDPEDKYHVLRFLGSFEDRDHLCLVLEPMDMNLRQVLKKYGANVGLNHRAIRVYAFKLIKALVLLKKNNIVHADIKPDNVLVNSDRTVVKVGDLGSAFETSEAEVTTELVSRFYRAPEIILGMSPTPAIDMWSLGTTLYELATGRFMIQSKTNNHHLKLIMELKGPFPKKLIQLCSLKDTYFDNEGYFLEEYTDPVSGHMSIHRVPTPSKPLRNLTRELMESYGLTSKASEEDKKLVNSLGDLIEQCTALDPRKRITPEQALKHPLF